MEEIAKAIWAIHFDLIGITTILIFILVFKDCHGNNKGIEYELQQIKEILFNKKLS